MKNEKLPETSLIIPVTPEFIERRIFVIRGQKVLLDSDLAELYQIETRTLIQSVKRNILRFPNDFMFKISPSEDASLRSQIVISKIGRGGRRYTPHVFTELGVAMLSSVLKSDRAVQMNIFIMRAFVKLRELLASHIDLAKKIEMLEMEQKLQGKDITDMTIVINKMIASKDKSKSSIGFVK